MSMAGKTLHMGRVDGLKEPEELGEGREEEEDGDEGKRGA